MKQALKEAEEKKRGKLLGTGTCSHLQTLSSLQRRLQMPKPKLQSKLRLRLTKSPELRNLRRKRPFEMDNRFLDPQLPHQWRRVLRLQPQLAPPVKTTKKPDSKYGWQQEGSLTRRHCGVTHVSNIPQGLSIECSMVHLELSEVMEFLAGQTLNVDADTVSLAQHFPR